MSAMPTYAMTYVVYWPTERVLKVGRAWKWHRVEMMIRSGAQVIVCARGTDATWEAEALRVLRRWFPQAFRRETDALGILPMGRGWTECFAIDEHDLQFALDRCIEGFARGNDQGVNEATIHQPVRPAVAGVPASAGRGEADRDGAVAPHGHRRAPGTDPGADRGRPVPGPSGDGDGRGAPAHARRRRVPDDLPRRGDALDRPRPTTPSRRSRGARRYSGAAFGSSMDVRGCGGSAGARACAGAGEGAGARGGRGASGRMGRGAGRARSGARTAGTAAPARCSTDRLLRAPQRHPERLLRTLPDCPPTARRMALTPDLRGEARDLPRATRGTRRGVGW